MLKRQLGVLFLRESRASEMVDHQLILGARAQERKIGTVKITGKLKNVVERSRACAHTHKQNRHCFHSVTQAINAIIIIDDVNSGTKTHRHAEHTQEKNVGCNDEKMYRFFCLGL